MKLIELLLLTDMDTKVKIETIDGTGAEGLNGSILLSEYELLEREVVRIIPLHSARENYLEVLVGKVV